MAGVQWKSERERVGERVAREREVGERGIVPLTGRVHLSVGGACTGEHGRWKAGGRRRLGWFWAAGADTRAR